MMDTSNWRPAQSGEPNMDVGDWRSQLQHDSRQRIVNKIMETLKRHLPVSGQEGLLELKNIAGRFEEKVYADATSQSDYLRQISLKMLKMETKSQNPAGNSLPSNSMVTHDSDPPSTYPGESSYTSRSDMYTLERLHQKIDALTVQHTQLLHQHTQFQNDMHREHHDMSAQLTQFKEEFRQEQHAYYMSIMSALRSFPPHSSSDT